MFLFFLRISRHACYPFSNDNRVSCTKYFKIDFELFARTSEIGVMIFPHNVLSSDAIIVSCKSPTNCPDLKTSNPKSLVFKTIAFSFSLQARSLWWSHFRACLCCWGFVHFHQIYPRPDMTSVLILHPNWMITTMMIRAMLSIVARRHFSKHFW